MDSTILRTSADIWTLIVPTLSYTSIENLFLVGNRTLIRLVSQGVECLNISGSVDCLHTTRLSFMFGSLQQLKQLSITSTYGAYFTKPLEPLLLPPKLTSLSVDLPFATEFVLTSGHIAALPESLVSLKLSTESVFCGRLDDIKFPSKLSTLVLSKGAFDVTEQSLATLPRTLTSLTLRVSELPEMTRYVWPLGLSALTLQSLDSSVRVESLPRTLTSLTIPELCLLKSSFTTPHTKFSFPWRVFFPFLKDLDIQVENIDLKDFMAGLVLPTAFDAHSVESFIANGFWGPSLPDLCYDSARRYPAFKRLIFLYKWADYLSKVVAVAKEFASYLSHCEAAFGYTLPPEAFQFLSSATSVIYLLPQRSLTSHSKLPLSLKHLELNASRLENIERLTSLETINVSSISANSYENVAWPQKLSSLTTSPIDPSAIIALPRSLTHLSCEISTSAAWNAVALNTVHLKSLAISFDFTAKWLAETPLTPIQAPLETLRLNYKCDLKAQRLSKGGPFFEAFFPVSGPSPLPASLTSLTICSYTEMATPMTLCPRLPRQLKKVAFLQRLDWFDWYSTPEPHVATMTYQELLEALPPGLEALTLLCATSSTQQANIETLRGLPLTLVYFEQKGAFKHATLAEVVRNLPPKLAHLSYAQDPSSTDSYLVMRRPNLYRIESP